MGNDDAKRLILARRARFVAAALASVAASTAGLTAGLEGCGGETSERIDGGASSSTTSSGNPQPCLSVQDPNPQPCLSPPLEPVDASAGDDGAPPQPCLSPPQPCLKIALDSGNPQPCLSMPPPDAGEK